MRESSFGLLMITMQCYARPQSLVRIIQAPILSRDMMYILYYKRLYYTKRPGPSAIPKLRSTSKAASMHLWARLARSDARCERVSGVGFRGSGVQGLGCRV